MDRDHKIQLRVTFAEKDEINRRAAKVGMTMSEWIRWRCLMGPPLASLEARESMHQSSTFDQGFIDD